MHLIPYMICLHLTLMIFDTEFVGKLYIRKYICSYSNDLGLDKCTIISVFMTKHHIYIIFHIMKMTFSIILNWLSIQICMSFYKHINIAV